MLTVIREAERRAQQCLSRGGRGQAWACVHVLTCPYKEIQHALTSPEKHCLKKNPNTVKHSMQRQLKQPAGLTLKCVYLTM